MINILDQIARTNSSALRSQFLPETPSEFLAFRLAAHLHDHTAVRHYVALAERYGDRHLLAAYRRVRESGCHSDLGPAFLSELERLAQRGTGGIEITCRRLAAIRIERRAVAVVILSGDHLDSPPQVRQLSSDGEKALGSAVAFITRLLEKRPFTVAAMEVMPDREEVQRTVLDQAITRALTESTNGVSIWRVAKREVLAAFGYPPLRFRNQAREAIEKMFPDVDGSFGGPLIKDALALGLYCQVEYLFNLLTHPTS
jgi:hypothetical protein